MLNNKYLTSSQVILIMIFFCPKQMNSYTTPTWGYKIISENEINFYHILISKISLDMLKASLPSLESIRYEKDGSITVLISAGSNIQLTAERIIEFVNKISFTHLDTPKFYYKIDSRVSQILKPWALTFEGCLAILLTHDTQLPQLINSHWELSNSTIGGIIVGLYTLLLHASYPQIIHPITLQNYQLRYDIEQKTTEYVKKMIKRITQAQPGYEGLAILSMLEEKTNIDKSILIKTLQDKTFNIQAPVTSPFFSD